MSDTGDDMPPQLCGDSSSEDEKPKRGGSDSDEPSTSLALTRPAGKQRRVHSPQVDAQPRSLASEFSAVDAPKAVTPPQTASPPPAIRALMAQASTAVKDDADPSASGEPSMEPAPSQTAVEESDGVYMPGLTNLSSGEDSGDDSEDDSDDDLFAYRKAQSKANRQAQRNAKMVTGGDEKVESESSTVGQNVFSKIAAKLAYHCWQVGQLAQKHVRIDGLTNQAHLNGLCGTVTSFILNFPSGRQVQLHDADNATFERIIKDEIFVAGRQAGGTVSSPLAMVDQAQLKCIVCLDDECFLQGTLQNYQVCIDHKKLSLAPESAASSPAPSSLAGQKRANAPQAGGASGGGVTNDAPKQRKSPDGDPFASLASHLQNGGSKEDLAEAMQASGPELLAALQAAGVPLREVTEPEAFDRLEHIGNELRTMASAGSCSLGACAKMLARLKQIKEDANKPNAVKAPPRVGLDPELIAAAERNVLQLQRQAAQEAANAKAEKAKADKEAAAKEAAERERHKLERQLREVASLTSLTDEKVGVWARWVRDVSEDARKPGAHDKGQVPDTALLAAAERSVLQLQVQAAQQRAIRAERDKAETSAATAALRKERDEALKREREQARQLKALQTDDRKSRRAELQKREKQLAELSSARDELRKQAEDLRTAKEQAEETLSLVLEGNTHTVNAQLESDKVEAARAAERARRYECPICMDEYVTHILYPCAHPFCASCVKQLSQHSRGGRGMVCPTCNQTPEMALQIYLG